MSESDKLKAGEATEALIKKLRKERDEYKDACESFVQALSVHLEKGHVGAPVPIGMLRHADRKARKVLYNLDGE